MEGAVGLSLEEDGGVFIEQDVRKIKRSKGIRWILNFLMDIRFSPLVEL